MVAANEPLLVVAVVGTGRENELVARTTDYHRGGAQALWILDELATK